MTVRVQVKVSTEIRTLSLSTGVFPGQRIGRPGASDATHWESVQIHVRHAGDLRCADGGTRPPESPAQESEREKAVRAWKTKEQVPALWRAQHLRTWDSTQFVSSMPWRKHMHPRQAAPDVPLVQARQRRAFTKGELRYATPSRAQVQAAQGELDAAGSEPFAEAKLCCSDPAAATATSPAPTSGTCALPTAEEQRLRSGIQQVLLLIVSVV